MEKQKTRDQIEDKYKWDLTTIFKNDNEWNDEYIKAKSKMYNLEKYKEKILDNAQNLYDILQLYFDMDKIVSKLYYYSQLKIDEDITNTKYQRMQSEILSLSNEIEKLSSYIYPEILKGDYNLIKQFCNENIKLKEYEFFFEKLFREKDHILGENDEKVLSDFANIVSNFQQGSNYLFTSEVKFENITDENGLDVKLTPSNLSVYVKSKDRNVRKQAYINSRQGYSNIINTISSNFIGKIKYDELEAKLRGYDSCLDKDLYSLNISKNVVTNLLEVGNNSINIYQKYLGLLKKSLKVDTLESWDLAMPLASSSDKEYSYEAAKNLILDVLKIYGDEYLNVLNKAFDERWIDVFPNEGKNTGWYSWGHYDSNPVVLGNFNSKIDDVSALAHELGHLVHFYMNEQNNSYIYSDHSILEAEVASLTNEIVLSLSIVERSNDKNEKLALLSNIIDVIASNFFGTVKGTEFLIDIHNKANKNEPLTADIISNEWKKIVDKFNGDCIKEYSYVNWARIPHYYRQYYYYKYATGVSAAVYNAKQILSGDKNKIDNYLKYLKVGSKDYPKNNLNIAGIDIEDKKLYEETVKFFDEILDKFIEISNS